MEFVNVKNVRKYSLIPIILKYMKGLTLERNHINVKNVVKVLVLKKVSKCMKEPILEKNPMNVEYVGKPSLPLRFRCIKEFTLGTSLVVQ